MADRLLWQTRAALWLLLLAGGMLAACRQPAPAATGVTLVAEASPSPTATRGQAYPAAGSNPYPVASATPSPAPYPPGQKAAATATPRATPSLPAPTRGHDLFAPLMGGREQPTATATATLPPTHTATPVPTPTPTIDFAAVRAQLRAGGQELGFAKIGFHAGVGGNRNGLGDWMRRLDAAGVPFFLKSVDDSGPLTEAQALMRASGLPHTLVYRRSGDQYDTPDYSLSPQVAAARHWQLHREQFPAELDPSLVWLETINEVDKGRSDWLAQFALETARLALADGFRWAAFGWSSGEPDVSDWESPAMLDFLRLAAAHPDQIAIALHEYSFLADDIGHEYPFKVGRFQLLYQVADRHGIPRPTVLITEWGWQFDQVPDVGQALADVAWAARLYAPYPQVKGAALWYLGGGYAGIAGQAQRLIVPLTEFSLGTYFAIPLPPAQAPINPELFRP